MNRYYIKNFLIVPLKATIFEKFPFVIMNRNFILCHHYYDGGRPQISVKSLWSAAHHPKNRYVRFYLPHLSAKKMADLLSLWQPLGTLFSPGNRLNTTEIGHGITEMN
jgi:hypothetical protein